jgi:hypothetical protein
LAGLVPETGIRSSFSFSHAATASSVGSMPSFSAHRAYFGSTFLALSRLLRFSDLALRSKSPMRASASSSFFSLSARALLAFSRASRRAFGPWVSLSCSWSYSS